MLRSIYLLTLILVSQVVWGQATLFEPNLVSDGKAFGLAISPNGKEMFWVRAFGGRDTLQIYHSTLVNGQWEQPRPAPFADARYKQIDPAFSPDGKMLLYNSQKEGDNEFDVYVVHKTASGWSAPEKMPEAINTTSSDFYATMSANKNIYFVRRTNSNDIYVSRFINNAYQPAVLLDSTINTDGNESNPYISKNEDYLIFFADRPNGFGGVDLYVSFNKQGAWSYPINLGKDINTEMGEFCPSVDQKNKRFIFSRTAVVDGKRIENVYSYPLKKLKLNKLKKLARWNG